MEREQISNQLYRLYRDIDRALTTVSVLLLAVRMQQRITTFHIHYLDLIKQAMDSFNRRKLILDCLLERYPIDESNLEMNQIRRTININWHATIHIIQTIDQIMAEQQQNRTT